MTPNAKQEYAVTATFRGDKDFVEFCHAATLSGAFPGVKILPMIVPNGWVFVPEALTEDMVVAFSEAWYSSAQTIDDPQMTAAYAAMLASTPKPIFEQEKWQLVPVVPTPEMLAAGDVHMDGISLLGDAWSDMLAAAQGSLK